MASLPANADWTDWNVSRPDVNLGDWTASVGADAGASAFADTRTDTDSGVNLAALLFPHVERLLDNGWTIGARGALLAYHDRLAGDIYGDRTFEKGYVFAQTPYGRFEAGEDDGAAYRMAMTGPNVDDWVGTDSAYTTFYRDPITHRAAIDVFRLQSAEFASANDAKFTYISPRWLGVQLGGSYTPYTAHGGLPFVSQGAKEPDQQDNVLEAAANYTGHFNALSYGVYAGVAHGNDRARTAGHADLLDWSAGGQADYSLGDLKFAFGGAYRRSDAYALDISDARAHGATQSWRLATTLTSGPWIVGFEYADGATSAASPQPALHVHGFEPSLAFVVNANLQLTAGWQDLRYRRSTGLFFNGSEILPLKAAFLHLRFRV